MSVKSFKFVSPGVFVNEIDNSQLPKVPQALGPVVIGRTSRGPGLRPIRVESFSDYINMFGDPIPGGVGGDAWREGNKTAPTYAAYAAQAWLRNNTPLTVIRLLGAQHTDATTAGAAGWDTKDSTGATTVIGSNDAAGGAYGLFIIDSGSTDNLNGAGGAVNTTPATGTLAAIWYINQGSIALSGSDRTGTAISGTAALIQSIGADQEFRAVIRDSNGNVVKTTTFNFNINSKRYIRRVFNTNPVLTNTSITTAANTASYWLGETFERFLGTYVTASTQYGMILGLKGDAATREGNDFRFGTRPSQTGWVFGQDLQVVSGAANSYQPENQTKLFRFVGLNTGEWDQANLKISIQDVKASTNPDDPYGTFTVVLRKAQDSDNAVRVIERYSSCNLNPYSAKYVAKKIGDRYIEWDDSIRRYREYGNYDNQSKFVRIEMNADVDAGAVNSTLLPFGFFGPVRHKGFAVLSGSDVSAYGSSAFSAFAASFIQGAQDSIVRAVTTGGSGNQVYLGSGSITGISTQYTGSFLFPSIPLRVSASVGNLPNPKRAYWGIDTSLNSTTVRFNPGYVDLVRPLPAGYDSFTPDNVRTEYSFIFTLDDISGSGNSISYLSGSRAAGTSVTATSSANYNAILALGHDKFTMPLHGGFDGLDITEKEPFNNTDLSNATVTTNYAYNSIKRAIDTISDAEIVEMNLTCMPGITNPRLTDHLIKTCEDRGDTLAIVDLEGGYLPPSENTNGDNSVSNRGDVATTISNLTQRGLNTSYGCAYYPWVQINDSINGASLFVPPSVVALGTMASSERKSELWFAPAGFTRGGLSEGSAGIPVIGVKEKLTAEDRDKLYEANINPIASFPSEGIVIFGQKTLQQTPSALDRINVRRLMVYLKKEISRMAASILFDQNVRTTWNRFLSKAQPFLESVQTRLGLTEYRIILDESTTTAELIDRNILYAKVLLKPARSIEFIAIDFVISNTGASFDD